MADDKNKTGAQDDQRINIHQDYEIRYWTKELECTEAELKKAVQAVGPMVKDVRKYLAKK